MKKQYHFIAIIIGPLPDWFRTGGGEDDDGDYDTMAYMVNSHYRKYAEKTEVTFDPSQITRVEIFGRDNEFQHRLEIKPDKFFELTRFVNHSIIPRNLIRYFDGRNLLPDVYHMPDLDGAVPGDMSIYDETRSHWMNSMKMWELNTPNGDSDQLARFIWDQYDDWVKQEEIAQMEEDAMETDLEDTYEDIRPGLWN